MSAIAYLLSLSAIVAMVRGWDVVAAGCLAVVAVVSYLQLRRT